MVKILIIAVIMIAGLVTLGVVENNMNSTEAETTLVSSSNTTTVTSEDEISVSLSGEVSNPGTYIMSTGDTLEDLVNAAGGVTDNADSKAYNLDYLLENKMSFYIAPIYDNSQVCSTTPLVKYNINTASATDLKNINGVKDNAATNIVSYRTSNKFKRIEELLDVDYIGTATFEKMKNYVTLK